jgi:hypothetical protein
MFVGKSPSMMVTILAWLRSSEFCLKLDMLRSRMKRLVSLFSYLVSMRIVPALGIPINEVFTKKLKSAREVLLSATVRDFHGGWDVLDNDLNLSTKYAIKLFNASLTADNAITVRYRHKIV